jgi:Putative Actinobacterial Holin-X, holin superfamily III
MEENVSEYPPMIDQLKSYAETKARLAKYMALQKGSPLVARIMTVIAALGCLLVGFIFASMTLGLYLGAVFGSDYTGFACVTLFYLCAGGLLMLFRNKLVKPIVHNILKRLCN